MLSPSTSAICQALSASIAELVSYPISLVRTREQAHLASPKAVTKYRGLFASFYKIYKSDGFSALYRGVWSSAMMSSISWGTVRYLYEHLGSYNFSRNEFNDCLIKTVIASFISNSIYHPLWIARISLQLESMQAKNLGWILSGNIFRWLYHTFTTTGFKGLFRGYSVSFLYIPQISLQMTLYESLKDSALFDSNSKMSFLNPYLPIIYGSLSRICGSLCTYPMMLSRAQMQCQYAPDFQKGIFRNILHTYRMKRFSGLFMGFRYQIIRSFIYGVSFYSSYEALINLANNISKS